MTSRMTAVGNTISVKQQQPLTIEWEEVYGHQPEVSGRPEKDQGGHLHLIP